MKKRIVTLTIALIMLIGMQVFATTGLPLTPNNGQSGVGTGTGSTSNPTASGTITPNPTSGNGSNTSTGTGQVQLILQHQQEIQIMKVIQHLQRSQKLLYQKQEQVMLYYMEYQCYQL